MNEKRNLYDLYYEFFIPGNFSKFNKLNMEELMIYFQKKLEKINPKRYEGHPLYEIAQKRYEMLQDDFQKLKMNAMNEFDASNDSEKTKPNSHIYNYDNDSETLNLSFCPCCCCEFPDLNCSTASCAPDCSPNCNDCSSCTSPSSSCNCSSANCNCSSSRCNNC